MVRGVGRESSRAEIRQRSKEKKGTVETLSMGGVGFAFEAIN